MSSATATAPTAGLMRPAASDSGAAVGSIVCAVGASVAAARASIGVTTYNLLPGGVFERGSARLAQVVKIMS